LSDTTRVSETLARPVRTAVQFIPSAVITEFIDAVIWNMDERQYAAVLALLTLIIGYFQILVENQVGVAFLRRLKPPVVPVISEEPTPANPGGQA
jgi:hypothetical protein